MPQEVFALDAGILQSFWKQRLQIKMNAQENKKEALF